MDDVGGYFKVWRRASQSAFWSKKPYVNYRGAWLTMLMMASPKEGFFDGHAIKPGQFGTSMEDLSKACGLTVSKTRTITEALKQSGMIEILNLANRFTLITICNWETYSESKNDKSQTNRKPIANQSQTDSKPKLAENVPANVPVEASAEVPAEVTPPVAPPPPAEKPVRPRNLLMDALGGLEGDIEHLTHPAWSKVAKALKNIKAASPDVTPQEIQRRADNYRAHFRDAMLTSTALSSHWARCDKGATSTLLRNPSRPVMSAGADLFASELDAALERSSVES